MGNIAVTVGDTEGTRADVGDHSFWKRGPTAILDKRIINLDTG